MYRLTLILPHAPGRNAAPSTVWFQTLPPALLMVCDHHHSPTTPLFTFALARFSLSDNLTAINPFATNNILLDQQMQCPANGSSPAFTAGITAPLNTNLETDIEYGVVAQGTFVPRNITQFGIFAKLGLSLLGRFAMQSASDVCHVF